MKSKKIVSQYSFKKWICYPFLFVFLLYFLNGCSKNTTDIPPGHDDFGASPTLNEEDGAQVNTHISNGSKLDSISPTPEPHVFIVSEGYTLEERINTPKGYHRVSSSPSDLVSFLRKFPMKADKSPVLLYDGKEKNIQSDHVAVFDMDIGDRDLQQCADSVMRIYAEYYWAQEDYDKIAFHLTNGFLMEYTKWREGNRLIVKGNNVSWNKSKGYDDSYESFREYLTMVFAYAGTLSLSEEVEAIRREEILPGDLFLQGGSPGHCIMVIDIAKDDLGNPCYLFAQGYMPAQDFHILKNPLHEEDPWYYEEELTYPLTTPSWTFIEGSLVRWADFPLEGGGNDRGNSSASSHQQLPESFPEQNQVTLLAVGDNLIHIEVVKSGKKNDGSYNYDHLYANLSDEISAADIAVINQETILGGEDFTYSGYPNFNSPTEIGDAIVKAGFDVILHASNHTMDKGLQGVKNTFSFWSAYPEIKVLGINESDEKRNTIPIIEKKGIKIALLNYTYGLNGYQVPGNMPYLVNLIDKKMMKADIQKAKDLADFIIVFPHWGAEYVYEPVSMQKDLTKFYYDLGVDLVIGAHPHVLEPVEWIETDPNHKMLVYYSLGNFISFQREAPRMLGGMAKLTIKKDSTGTYISEAGITPLVTHYEIGPLDYNYGLFHLTDYTEEQALLHGVSSMAVQGDITYEDIYQLARQVLGNWFQNE